MANAFSKEETVAFDTALEAFNDALVLSKNVATFSTDQTVMERSSDVIWRPQPYIATSYAGTDATSNFNDVTQLSVPASINIPRHVPMIMTSTELRDALQEQRFGMAAAQKLASDVNNSLSSVASLQGTLVVKRTSAAAGFTDIAQCDSIMNEQGVQQFDRIIALNSRDYNNMADNLAVRSTVAGKVQTAYEKGLIGNDIGGFKAYKIDAGLRLAAAAGGGSITIDTRDVGANYYNPAATSTGAGGQVSNVDNRYDTVTVSSTTSVAAGDCFTIAGLYAVHHITKQSTGQLKTFRVISVDSSTTMTISPPIITNQVSNAAAAQYQNCTIETKASNSAIVFLNTVAAPLNYFWQRDALEILPGRQVIPTAAGVAVMKASTDQGIEVMMQKFVDINTNKIKFRWDVFYGVCCKQPEMAGIMLFSQS